MNLAFLRPMYDQLGPWASAYLDDSRDTESGAEEVRLRWRSLRNNLREQGLDDETAQAMEDAVIGVPHRPGNHGLAVFARDPTTVHTDVLNVPPAERADVAPLPHVTPLLLQHGEQISWLRVVADRTGATIEEVAAGLATRTVDVEGGEAYPIRKVAPGGWSQARFQREAETTWRRNAGDVATAVTELADQTAADVIVVAGDVHARRMLVEQLPVRLQERVAQTDAGSRAPGADPEALDDVTMQVIAETADTHTGTVLDRFRQNRGEEAARGLEAVLDAVNRSQVDTLLLDPTALGDTMLWLSPESGQLAREKAQLDGLGPVEHVRADDALIRATAITDASLLMLGLEELELPDGVGAVLRYSDASTRHE